MMRNQNSRKVFFTALLFSLFINPQLGNAAIYNDNVSSSVIGNEKISNPVEIISSKVIAVDYFSVQLEIILNIDKSLGEQIFLQCEVPFISKRVTPYLMSHGKNTIKVVVDRENLKKEQYLNKWIQISVFNSKQIFFKDAIRQEINWPGPEYALQLTKTAPVISSDFTALSIIQINRNLPEFNSIVKALLIAGLPIEKIETFGVGVTSGNNLRLGEDIDPAISKKMVSLVLSTAPGIKTVIIKNDEINHDNQSITVGGYENGSPLLDASKITKLKSENLSDNDFFLLVGFTPQSTTQKVLDLYNEAHFLINFNRPESIKQAKADLDELLNLDPNFPKAYLELARYYMKVSRDPATGFSLAEKSILIAKNIDPQLADTRVLLGYVYTNQGRYKEAENEYSLAKKLGTDNLWLYANWGLNYQFQNQDQMAIDKYLKVLENSRIKGPNDRPRLWVFNSSDFFNLLIGTKQFQLADKMYQKFSEEYPEYNCILQDQAALRVYYLNNYTQAIESYLKASKIGCRKETETISIAYYMKWKALKSTKALDLDIVSALRQAEALSPSDSQLFYKLATSDYTASVIPDIKNNGKNINSVDSNSMTPLLLAVSAGKKDVAERLLKNGANINQLSGDQNYFALGVAVYTDNSDMVELLMKYKADPNLKFMGGPSLQDVAKEQGNDNIIKLLNAGKKV